MVRSDCKKHRIGVLNSEFTALGNGPITVIVADPRVPTEPMGVFNGNNDRDGEIIGSGSPRGAVNRHVLRRVE